MISVSTQRRKFLGKFFIASAWLSPLLLAALWCMMHYAGDRWWLATMLMFGPRWMLLVPVLLLVPMTVFKSRWCWLPVIVSVLIILWPIMGFNIPAGKAASEPTGTLRNLRVVTCNLDTANFDTSVLTTMIRDLAADVAAFQEYPHNAKVLMPAGWSMVKEGGLAVASRYPIEIVKAVQIKPQGLKWPGTYLLHAVVHAPGRDIAFCSIHLPTPRSGLMMILDRHTVFRPARNGLYEVETSRRKSISLELSRYVDAIKMPVIVAGDFNTPVESPLFRQSWDNYDNAFSRTGWGYGWTQRARVVGFSYSARIDHVLTRGGLVPRLSQIGKDVGSGHLPLIVDIGY